jgi:hypothetical protein
MRFMMFMLPNEESQVDPTLPGQEPTPEAVEQMGRYNEELGKAGVLLDLSGLHPPHQAVRVRCTEGRRTVTDGPFTEAKEAIGGYWLIDVKSKEEAVEWAKRVPVVHDDFTIELRQVFEIDEFSPEVQEAARAHEPDRRA